MARAGRLEKDWIAQYGVMGAGNGFAGSSFPNQTKILPGNPDLDTANVGQYISSDVMPGRVVDGALIRRPVIFYNICYGVNAFADPAHHEAAYLFLQWAGGARVYTFLTAQPGRLPGSAPHLLVQRTRLVRRATSRSRSATFSEIVPRTAPPITLKGGGAYRDSLSEEIQKVLTKQQHARAGGEVARRPLGQDHGRRRASRSQVGGDLRRPFVVGVPDESPTRPTVATVSVAGSDRPARS